MGLFKRIKKQLLSVIEWTDSSKNTIVYKYPLTDRDEIMNSSKLVVRPSQAAIFVHKGQVADIFGPGTYTLSTENIPIITKILALPTGFNSPIKAEVYFVNTKQFTGLKWGTQNPIIMRDADYGNIRIRAYGVYSFKVEDAKKFMEEMFGTNPLYTVEDAANQLRPLVIQNFSDTVAESKIGALDLAANYVEFGKKVSSSHSDLFSDLGLKLTNMVIENISVPEEVEKALDERTKLGVIEDKLGTYTQYQAAQAMKAAAENPNGGNLAGLGVGLGAGVGIGEIFSESIRSAKNKPSKTKSEETKTCPECKTEMKASAKFCPECGKKMPTSSKKHCPECGTEVKSTAKFCPECGTKLWAKN